MRLAILLVLLTPWAARAQQPGQPVVFAVGGLGTPISGHFPGVRHFRPLLDAKRLETAIRSHDGPVTIVGFSFGARRAIEMGKYDNVVAIHAHSPGGPIQFPRSTSAKVTIYRTQGDRLTYRSSGQAYETLKRSGASVSIKEYPATGFPNHQFRNAIHDINFAIKTGR